MLRSTELVNIQMNDTRWSQQKAARRRAMALSSRIKTRTKFIHQLEGQLKPLRRNIESLKRERDHILSGSEAMLRDA